MKIVDLAEEVGTDPLLIDMFTWSMHHGIDENAAAFVQQGAEAILANASQALTKTGRKIKIDQALHVLRLLASKAESAGPEDQAIFCTAVANVVAKSGAS
jgi:hypothetical protein